MSARSWDCVHIWSKPEPPGVRSPVGCQKLRGEVRGDEVLAQSVQVGGVSQLVQR